MRRLALILIAAALALLGVMELRQWLASPETKIRWRIEQMVGGFNDAHLAPCLKGVAESWWDEGGRVDREELADALRYLFLQERDPQTKAFRFRVELEEGPATTLDPEDGSLARAALLARFDRLARGEWSPTWRVRIEAELAEDEEHGWQVTWTERETLWSDGKLVRATR